VAHILENRHEYRMTENTLQLLKACQKGSHMNCWEALYIQAYHQQKVLIAEQQFSDTNPLFELANITNASQRVQ
jgi:hypothetical protein